MSDIFDFDFSDLGDREFEGNLPPCEPGSYVVRNKTIDASCEKVDGIVGFAEVIRAIPGSPEGQEGRTVRYMLSNSEKARSRMAIYLVAMGYTKEQLQSGEVSIDFNDFVGKEFEIDVVQGDYTDDAGVEHKTPRSHCADSAR